MAGMPRSEKTDCEQERISRSEYSASSYSRLDVAAFAEQCVEAMKSIDAVDAF